MTRVDVETSGPVRSDIAGARWMLAPVVALSGFVGLGYEIVWTRELGFVLGTEMMAALGVIAGFFGGLALGAFLLDGPIRRSASPFRAYAILEFTIGVWGLVSLWLLPRIGLPVARLLGPDPSPLLTLTACFLLPAICLLPATAAMGGTLTALERMITATRQGPSAGRVYGLNTAGAVIGALVSTFWLLPQFGLSTTLACLVVVNLGCGCAALILNAPESVRVSPRHAGRLPLRLMAALFLTGLLGIAFETLIIRLAAQVMQDTVYTFAALLIAYLLGASCGSLVQQRLAVRFRAGPTTLLVLVTLTCLLTTIIAPHAAAVARASSDLGLTGEMTFALILFFLPSAAMGALFGHLAQQVRDRTGSIGLAVGVNSIGCALAPLVATQILIPAFGVWPALIPVALAYLTLLPVTRRSLAIAAAPVAIGVAIWFAPPAPLALVPDGGRLLALREGSMATASVVEDAAGVRYLEVNGRSRMGGTSSARSDFRQGLLPLLMHPAPRDALFLGLGTGATLVGGSRYPGVTVKGVELSQEVVDLMPWFIDAADRARLPPITVADARRYIQADRATHDVIVADLFHPALDGSGALYTVEHFSAVRERLAPGGVFCQWLPLYQLDAPSLKAIIRSFLDVYPNGSAWLNHYSVGTPMLALIGARNGALQLDNLEGRLTDPGVQAVLSPLGLRTPIDVFGQFVAGPVALRSFAGEGVRNTDDYPFVIFDAVRNVEALSAPPWVLLLNLIRDVRTDAKELTAADRMSDTRLRAYWQARNQFLQAGAALRGNPRGLALIDAAAPGLLAAVRASDEFDPAYEPLLAMAQALLQQDRSAGERLLNAMIEAAPARPEARLLLTGATP